MTWIRKNKLYGICFYGFCWILTIALSTQGGLLAAAQILWVVSHTPLSLRRWKHLWSRHTRCAHCLTASLVWSQSKSPCSIWSESKYTFNSWHHWHKEVVHFLLLQITYAPRQTLNTLNKHREHCNLPLSWYGRSRKDAPMTNINDCANESKLIFVYSNMSALK